MNVQLQVLYPNVGSSSLPRGDKLHAIVTTNEMTGAVSGEKNTI